MSLYAFAAEGYTPSWLDSTQKSMIQYYAGDNSIACAHVWVPLEETYYRVQWNGNICSVLKKHILNDHTEFIGGASRIFNASHGERDRERERCVNWKGSEIEQ